MYNLKKILYHRLAPLALVLIASVVLTVLGLGDGTPLILSAVAVVAIGAYCQIGFGTLPQRRPNLRVI